jgi:two-component system, cell cycle sensor histidine kinase and response regulator CckA
MRHSLSESELLDALPEAVVASDAKGIVVAANRRTEELFGYAGDELIGQPLDVLLSTAGGRGRRRDGVEFPVEVASSPLETREGPVTVAAIRDAAFAGDLGAYARRQAEIARLGVLALEDRPLDILQDEVARSLVATLSVEYSTILELRDDRAAFVLRSGVGFAEGAVGRAKVPVAKSQAGSTLEHGRVVVSDLPGDPRFDGDALLREHDVVSGVTAPVTVHGEVLASVGAYSTRARTFMEGEQEFVSSLAAVLGASLARRRAQTALVERTTMGEVVLGQAPAAIYLKDLAGRYLYANAELTRLVDLPLAQMLGRTDAELLPAAVAGPVRANDRLVLDAERPLRLIESVLVDGTEHVYDSLKFPLFDDHGATCGLGGISMDVTERVRGGSERAAVEEHLVRSDRLESSGLLVAGIAHDFNNVLAVIGNYARFVAAEVTHDEQLADDVEQIVLAAKQGGELTRKLLEFSRPEPADPEVLDLAEVLGALESALERALCEHIVLRIECEADLEPVRVDRRLVEQALSNLAHNAGDAMPEGGMLRIEAHNALPKRAPVDDVAIAGYVRLSVQDTGTGMSADVAARAFEPFFTTKAGRSGLGLTSVHGIVVAAGGWVELESEVGSGTAITIWLPAAAVTATGRAASEVGAPPGTRKRVLLVEDEPGAREARRGALSAAGYEVVAEGGGIDALSALSAGFEPDVLVTNLRLPDITGAELAERVHESFPRLPVVLVSGITHEVTPEGAPRGSLVRFVEKPFPTARLLGAVRDALV